MLDLLGFWIPVTVLLSLGFVVGVMVGKRLGN